MIVEYKTQELVIAGNGRKYIVFDTLRGDDNSLLVNEAQYQGSLPQCKAFVDGYMLGAETH